MYISGLNLFQFVTFIHYQYNMIITFEVKQPKLFNKLSYVHMYVRMYMCMLALSSLL